VENSPPQKLRLGIENLKNEGLNLFAIMDIQRLPDQVVALLTKFNLPVSDQTRIILIGNGGRALWESIPPSLWLQADPVDQHSSAAACRFARQILTQDNYQIIYPGDTPVALQQLGTIAGWHTPSPLGIGINPQWGLWYAYRVAVITNDPLPEILQPAPPSPCAACAEKPCLSVCPAGALCATSTISIDICASYRLAPKSSCADRCRARMSCPVATEQRYTLDQIQYHYRLSLETLRHYFG